MASKTKNTSSLVAPSPPIEFEPYCEWHKEEGLETLAIHLPDFKREQLRVQVTNQGVLRVSGERLLDGATSKPPQRTKRFVKETKLPQSCNINDIKAKFTKGRLHITMPIKMVQIPNLENTQNTPKEEEAKPPQIPHDHIQDQELIKAQSGRNEEGKMGNDYHLPNNKDHMFGLGSSMARLQKGKKVILYFGIGVVIMVAIGAFVAYKFGSDFNSSSPVEELGLNL